MRTYELQLWSGALDYSQHTVAINPIAVVVATNTLHS